MKWRQCDKRRTMTLGWNDRDRCIWEGGSRRQTFWMGKGNRNFVCHCQDRSTCCLFIIHQWYPTSVDLPDKHFPRHPSSPTTSREFHQECNLTAVEISCLGEEKRDMLALLLRLQRMGITNPKKLVDKKNKIPSALPIPSQTESSLRRQTAK